MGALSQAIAEIVARHKGQPKPAPKPKSLLGYHR